MCGDLFSRLRRPDSGDCLQYSTVQYSTDRLIVRSTARFPVGVGWRFSASSPQKKSENSAGWVSHDALELTACLSYLILCVTVEKRMSGGTIYT